MMKQRESLFIACIGKKAVGKTETTLKSILSSVRGNQSAGIRPLKALLCDVSEEFANFELKSIGKRVKFKELAIKDVPLFRRQTVIEARRVRFFNDDGNPMELKDVGKAVYFILKNFKDGIILIEDPNKFMAKPTYDILGVLATQRHSSVDVFVHYQFFQKILNPSVFGNLNIVRLHATIDSVDKYKYDIGDQYELFRIAESIVNLQVAAGNTRFYVYINMDTSRIYGKFSEAQFMAGVSEYMSACYKRAVKPTLERRDEKGRKMYDAETAFRIVRQNLFDNYYGGSAE